MTAINGYTLNHSNFLKEQFGDGSINQCISREATVIILSLKDTSVSTRKSRLSKGIHMYCQLKTYPNHTGNLQKIQEMHSSVKSIE